MIDGRNFFNQPIKKMKKKDLKTYDNLRKIATSKGDNYTTRCLVGYLNFRNY